MEQPMVKSGTGLNPRILIIAGVIGAGSIGFIILLVIFNSGGEPSRPLAQTPGSQNTSTVVFQEQEQFSQDTRELVSGLNELIKLTENLEEGIKTADLPSTTLEHASKVAEEELKKVAKTLPKARADALKDLCNNAKVTLDSKKIIKGLNSDTNKVPSIQEIGTLKKAEELGTTLKQEIKSVIQKTIEELKVPYKELILFLARPDACYGKLKDIAYNQFRELQMDDEKAKSLPSEIKPTFKLIRKQSVLKAKAVKYATGKEKPKSVRTLEKLVFMSPELGLEANQVDDLEAIIKDLRSKRRKGGNDSAKEESSASSSSEVEEKPSEKVESETPAKPAETKPNDRNNESSEEEETEPEPEKPTVAMEHIVKFKKDIEDLFAPGYDYTKLQANFQTAANAYLAEVKKTGPAPISETNNVRVVSELMAFEYLFHYLNPIKSFAEAVGDPAVTEKAIIENKFPIFGTILSTYRKDPVKGAKVYNAAVRYYDFFIVKGDKTALGLRGQLPFLKSAEEFLASIKPLCGPEDNVFLDGMGNFQCLDSNDLFSLLHLIIKTNAQQTDRNKTASFLGEFLAEVKKREKGEEGHEGQVIAKIISATLSVLQVHAEIINKGVQGWDVQKFANSLNLVDITNACSSTNAATCKFLLGKTNEYFDLIAIQIFTHLNANWFAQENKSNIYTALKASVEKYYKVRFVIAKYELIPLVASLGKPDFMGKLEAFETGDGYFPIVKDLAKISGHEKLFEHITKYFEAHYQYAVQYKPGPKAGEESPATTAARHAAYNMKTLKRRYALNYYRVLEELQAAYSELPHVVAPVGKYAEGILGNPLNASMVLIASDPSLFNDPAKADDHKKAASKFIWIDKLYDENISVITDKAKADAAFGKFHTGFIKNSEYIEKVVQRIFLEACQTESKPKPFFKLISDGKLDTSNLSNTTPTVNLAMIFQNAVDAMNNYAKSKGLKVAIGGSSVKDFTNLKPEDLPTPYDTICQDIEALEGGAIKALYDQSIADLK